MPQFLTLDDVDLKGKTVLVRADLNVPMQAGKITDYNRVNRLLPTLRELMDKGAKIVLISHFGRPKGEYVPSMSLAPLTDALSDALGGVDVHFGVDCIGGEAREAIEHTAFGELVLLENLRFHPEEGTNDAGFAEQLAQLGDIFVNDAFSCSHRAHASVVGITEHLPAVAGRLMQDELEALSKALETPQRPLAAIVGGSKVSTKIPLLEQLVEKVNTLIIGGGMANTFLHARGKQVGASLCEKDMRETVDAILTKARNTGCDILLPSDVIVAKAFEKQAPNRVITPSEISEDEMILDIGPISINSIYQALLQSKTLVWNGPVGAFETSPFDISTAQIARLVASLTQQGKLVSIAGGGDTVAALRHAGLAKELTYLSSAGGAFLEWMEGKELPGVAALRHHARHAA